MAEGPIPADAAHAMQTVTRYQQQDRTERGRFGRDVLAPATEDVQMADARKTMQSEHADDGFENGRYEIDADAVADAIIARLMAGRTLHRHPADEQ
jgi:anti-sigma28 factor (negative regulator of flagellin synthesis)